MSYKIQCTVDTVFNTEQITESFSKRVLWVKTNEQYQNEVELQFVNNNTSLLDNVEAGDAVEVTFYVGGRKNEKGGNVRIFNQLTATAIRKL